MRPVPVWNGFFAQWFIVRVVAAMAAGARAIGALLPHLLFLGNSGLGKTALARAVAIAYGSTLYVIIARKDLDFVEIETIIESTAHGDIIFIDEVHSLRSAVQEQLYQYMDYALACENKKLQGSDNEPSDTENKYLKKALTFIAATDRPGELEMAFKKRFCHTLELRPYSSREMTAILRVRAQKRNILLTPHASRLLAQTCKGIPRLAEHRVACLMTFFGEDGLQEFDTPQVRQFLRAMGIDRLGLGRSDRNYLLALRERDGDSASPNFLAAKLHCDVNYVVNDLEPYLLQCGLIDITKRGRVLTAKGVEHIQGNSDHEDAKNHG